MSRTSADRVDLAQQRRRLAHQDRAGAERLEDQAEAGQLVGRAHDALGLGGVELDDLGDQQRLARDAAGLHLGLHALVDQPLVRGVLVDDDDAVAGLGDDIGLVQLGAGGAEREGRWGRSPRRRRGASGRLARGPRALRRRQHRSTPRLRRPAAGAPGREAARARAARSEAAERGCGDRGRGAMAGAGQRMAQRADDQPAHQRRIAEAHLRLGRMHVDVDQRPASRSR